MAEIGSTLREARMRARIDISEVEAQTKIRAKYLRALENEEWDLLPGSVYVKSFLKTYGSYLGLDSRLLVDEFKRRYERPMDHEPRPQPTVGGGSVRELRERQSRSRGQRRRPQLGSRFNTGMLVSPPVLIVVLLLVIGGALALIGSLNSGGNNAGGGDGGSGGRSTTTHHGTSTPGTTTTQTTHHRHRHRLATLALVPTGTIYVCVKRPGGTQVLAGTYATGQTIPKMSGKTLLVTLGNANATVKVNGKPYSLTPSSTPIGLRIDRSGAAPLSPGPTCT